MEIFNRPPTISEDSLQYAIYPAPDAVDRASVTSLAAQIESFVNSLLPGHIWNRDSFELKLASQTNSKNNWFIEGHMRVGDGVDDEWCVVWLLREISKRWDVVISVFDSDGEFLLIEAADYLPSWVEPTNVQHRVWICRAALHLIPLSYVSPPSTRSTEVKRYKGHDSDEDVGDDADEYWLNIQDALKTVRSSDDTEAPKEMQDVVWKRISGYPSAAQQHVHTTKAFIPKDIARALSQNPSLIQRAVETFYTRDAIQLRAAHRMSRFTPQSIILTPVKMTRTAYAQLMGQKFHPPKIFGTFKEREGSNEHRWRDIGMKIACGFEMLYQETKSRSEGINTSTLQASAAARKDTLRRNPEYTEYIQKLVATGYFKGELEGSMLWNELETKAADVFINSKREDDASRSSFAKSVNEAIAVAGDNQFVPNVNEDSDDWLHIDIEDFDKKLAEVNPGTSKLKSEPMDVDEEEDKEIRTAKAQAEKLQGFAKKVENFVEGKGTMDGAMFEDEEMSDDEQLSEFSDEEFPSESEEDEISRAAQQEAMDKLVPGIDPSDYGKMPPSFYRNSQKVASTTVGTEVREATSRAPEFNQDEVATFGRPIRDPILPRDNFDGVDSDDETDEEEVDDESEEDKPLVVGEVEIDMNEEQEEFLSFSREVLGISDDMWKDILRDRQSKGASIPRSSDAKQSSQEPSRKLLTSNESKQSMKLRSPKPGPRPGVNPNLDSFEAVMEAMEAELTRARVAKKKDGASLALRSQIKQTGVLTAKDKGKGKAANLSIDMDETSEDDIEDMMEAELRTALEKDADSGDEESMDYSLIKNFLESFKSQAGLAGPVGSLAGRLDPGWALPRDDR